MSSAIQLLVLAGVPFLVYLITHRRVRGFLHYIGLYRPEARSFWMATGVALVATVLVLGMFSLAGLREVMTGPGTVSGRLREMGPSAETVVHLLLYAWVQTALAEEILFRGFIARRLIAWLGFGIGNAVQAVLFGGLHLLLFAALAGQAFTALRVAALLVVPALYGWLLGYLKERAGNGSILPGWWAHGLGNTLSYLVVAFFW